MEQEASSSKQSVPFPISMLLDELQEKILSYLPIDEIVMHQTVQKKWHEGIQSWALGTPINYKPHPQKPYYIMFNSEMPFLETYAYKSDKQRWVHFDFPNSDDAMLGLPFDVSLFSEYTFDISASCGLVCFMDVISPENIVVFNPIIKNQIRTLPKPSDAIADYCAVTLSTDVGLRKYFVAMVKSSQSRRTWFNYEVTIQLYRSERRSWINLHSENIVGWHTDSCIICNDILYCVAEYPYMMGDTKPRHAIVSYDLSQEKRKQSLADTILMVPCAMTCVKLLNLNGKFILVGGILEHGTPNLEAIGVWEKSWKTWKQITRTPDNIINQYRKKIDETFTSSGCENMIFIQSCVSRTLLTYKFDNKVWTLARKPPLPLLYDDSNYFGGFCFEPRLDVIP